jgi:short-subunit dehydrogenase
MNFEHRYGPWAVIAGASEGVGSEAARLLGERGINVVLVSRRQALLDEVAKTVPAQTRTLPLDLSKPDAAQILAEATADLEVGLLIYNAGAVNPAPFLDHPVQKWLDVITRNVSTVQQSVHHFAGLMVQRGRGGVVLVSSNAAWSGAAQQATYGASKRFDLVFAESLWAELSPRGVDVLAMVLGATDTPAFRELLAGKVLPMDSSEHIAREMLENLANGPTWPPGPPQFGTTPRKEVVETRSAAILKAGLAPPMH